MPVRAAQNITVTYNSTDITGYLNTAALDAVVKEVDVTNLASSGKEAYPGIPSFSSNIGGLWAKALDDVLGPDAASPPNSLRTLVITLGPSAEVTYTWTSSSTTGAFIGNYKINATNPLENITWSGTLAVSGSPVRA